MSENKEKINENAVLEEVKQQIEDEFKNNKRFKLRDILLKPFKFIKEFVQWVGDLIFVKTIPEEDRAEVMQKAIDENYKETKRLAEEQRRPDAKTQEMKKEILANENLTMEQKLEALCDLCLQSGKDITVALTKGIDPDKTKAPDAILVIERQANYVQIQFAPKEFKTKNAEPSYNLIIKGGINYDDKGNATHKGLKETAKLINMGFKPDLDRIYIDRNNMAVESSQNLTEIDTEPVKDENSQIPIEVINEHTEGNLTVEEQMMQDVLEAARNGNIIIPEQNIEETPLDIANTAAAAAAIYADMEEKDEFDILPEIDEDMQEIQDLSILSEVADMFQEEMELDETIQEGINSQELFKAVLNGDISKATEMANADKEHIQSTSYEAETEHEL